MRYLKLSLYLVFSFFLLSCYHQEVVVMEPTTVSPIPSVSIANMVQSKELWYVDTTTLQANGVPFLDKAFTISFLNNTMYTNANMVGFGSIGDGFGDAVADYRIVSKTIEISHDIDGLWVLELYPVDQNRIELYHRPSNTSYFLQGYDRAFFDYDAVFYQNIPSFLQEYTLWKKVSTSAQGSPNAFDKENYLQFSTENAVFLSSKDMVGTPVSSLLWDYHGNYMVDTTSASIILTLDYASLGNETFFLHVIHPDTIELVHIASGTSYIFKGVENLVYLKPTRK